MFAVPGWSVASSALKTQRIETTKLTVDPSKAAAKSETPAEDGASTSKKRKRNGKSKPQDVNAGNLAEMWDAVIEGNEKPKVKKEKAVKKQKLEPAAATDEVAVSQSENAEGREDGQKAKKKTMKESKREKKQKRKELQEANGTIDTSTSNASPVSKPAVQVQKPKPTAPVPTPAAAPKLTPLQASMRQKLISARFRHLNQTLYTTPSKHSLELFQQNPEMFQEYHEGFRRQVEVWPENPVDSYISQIRERAKVRGSQRGAKDTKTTESSSVAPLPRTEGTCNIADLGCGDAGISHGLEKEKKKHKLQIHSFDLQSPSPLVTRADIANLPLADDSVDVAIFCLALMGTNWVDFIEEAFRILRWKGELWIAEIKSRFGRVSSKAGSGKVVEHSVGNRKKAPKVDKKTLKKMEEDADDATAMVEVDGHEIPQETDVSAFVEVLRKRGFVLQSENAVDLSNRMFVKMSFVKAATPIKGKCVPVPKGMEKMGMETWKKKPKAKFIEDEDEHVSSEAAVLKPCVYKIR